MHILHICDKRFGFLSEIRLHSPSQSQQNHNHSKITAKFTVTAKSKDFAILKFLNKAFYLITILFFGHIFKINKRVKRNVVKRLNWDRDTVGLCLLRRPPCTHKMFQFLNGNSLTFVFTVSIQSFPLQAFVCCLFFNDCWRID